MTRHGSASREVDKSEIADLKEDEIAWDDKDDVTHAQPRVAVCPALFNQSVRSGRS